MLYRLLISPSQVLHSPRLVCFFNVLLNLQCVSLNKLLSSFLVQLLVQLLLSYLRGNAICGLWHYVGFLQHLVLQSFKHLLALLFIFSINLRLLFNSSLNVFWRLFPLTKVLFFGIKVDLFAISESHLASPPFGFKFVVSFKHRLQAVKV